MTTTTPRRAVLAGSAAIIIPTACVGVDPIYAAIQRHRDAYAARGAALEARRDDDTGAMFELDFNARNDLITTHPTTIAGAAALCRYVAEFAQQPGEEGIWGDEEGYLLYPNLAVALEKMSM
jgi:hypothetical protein